MAELYEYALQPEHRISKGDVKVLPTTITDTGALNVFSGRMTGRSPKEKRIVLDEVSEKTIWWGDVNIPLAPIGYTRNKSRAVDFLNTTPRIFVIDGYAGWDPSYKIKTRIICSRPYHALFMKQMLIRDTET